MKRILLAVLAGLTMTGAVAGAASVLTVDGGVMQSGVDTDLTCDADGVYLSYAPEHTGDITSAKINDVDPECVGQKVVISFNDAGNLRAAALISPDPAVTDTRIELGVSMTTQTVKLSSGGLILTLPDGTQAADLTGFRMLIHSTP